MYYKVLDHNGHFGCDSIALAGHNCLFKDKTFRVLLIYFETDFLNDIQDHAYLGGDAAIDSGIERKVADHYIDITEERNLNLLRRSFSLGIAECEQMMLFLTKNKIFGHMSLDSQERPNIPEYLLEMRVDCNSSENTVVLIQQLVFSYVIARAIRDYCLDAYPAGAERWGLQMDQCKEQIAEAARTLDVKGERRPWPYIW